MNVATVLLGDFNEDLPEKLAWINPLQQTYGHRVYVACRNRSALPAFQAAGIVAESSEASATADAARIAELEEWLGVAFRHLICRDWRLFDRKKCNIWYDETALNGYVAGQVMFLRDFFQRNDIRVLVVGLESYLFHLIAYHVAQRMGITIVNTMLRRLPKCGVMFCRENYRDIWTWNDDSRAVNAEMRSVYDSEEIMAATNRPKINLGNYWHPKNAAKNIRLLTGYYLRRRALIRRNSYERYLRPSAAAVAGFALGLSVRKLLNSRLLRFEKPDSNDKYFFFPLHYENDAAIAYREPFLDQLGMIRAINRTLPADTWLYLKPHPHYLGAELSFRQLSSLLKMGNIKLIHPAVSPISLLKDAVGVITVNSTTGFEALVYNKPVITFGHDFYCREDLCYLVRDTNDIPDVLFKVLKERKPPSDRRTIDDFTATVYRNAVFTEGELNNPENPITADDGRNIAAALARIFHKTIVGPETIPGKECLKCILK